MLLSLYFLISFIIRCEGAFILKPDRLCFAGRVKEELTRGKKDRFYVI